MSDLLTKIENTPSPSPTLWWLGRGGCAIKFHSIVFYVDPWFPGGPGPERVCNADMVLRTHVDGEQPDPTPAILAASPRAKALLPKSNAERLHGLGVPYDRMTTTDADLRVEYFKAGIYGRVYSVPSSRGGLYWTPLGGYPYLGYLIRFGECTIYHAGLSEPYAQLAERLRPYNVNLALLPVGGEGFTAAQAGQLAEDIGCDWVAPLPYSEQAVEQFLQHMLGHRPAQRFKLLQEGQAWRVGDDGGV